MRDVRRLNNRGAGRSKGKGELRTWEYEGEIKGRMKQRLWHGKKGRGRDERGRKGCISWIKGRNLKRDGKGLR